MPPLADSECEIDVTESPADTERMTVQGAEPDGRSARIEERPGVLRGGATLTLQTRQAQRLVKGRGYTAEKPAIIGLIGFANLVRSIWHGARADDPYADWWMLRVHEALEQSQEELRTAEQEIATRFQAMGAIEVGAPASIKPARIALNFSNPYAFRAARLVGLYDGLVRSVLSAQHVGLLARDETERALQLGGRQVRRALQSAVGYRFIGVTRPDIAQGTAKALQAHEAMGELPADILSGTCRAPYAPAIVASTAPVTDPLNLRPLPDLT